MLLLGVLVGVSVGILPGLGGTVGMSLLLPFVFGLRNDPVQAIALLMGLAAVIHTADTFPSVLLGVPGSSGSQATIMDGYPMARRGEATRALSAAFFSSMFGGLIGAITLLAVLPIARPLVLRFGPPEQFMLAMLGLSMVAVLAGKRPLRGLIAGALGLLIGSMRAAPNQSDVFRYSFDTTYLWSGIPLAVLALGLFAVPEMLNLLAARESIASSGTQQRAGQIFTGLRDVIRNRLLVLRSAVVGVIVGFIPGLGGSVVDWISYGVARQTVKKDPQFGAGDVRGVIAPESSNNAKEGGALIPTLLFGIPGSGTTAVLLSSFVILGFAPGRDMLKEDGDLDITVLIIATLAVANVFGTLACLSVSRIVARVATIRAARLVPFVLIVMLVGAYQSTKNWGDLIAMAVIGLLGWVMVHTSFPLPPLLIGFVLSAGAERNMFLSNGAKQLRDLPTYSWVLEPTVLGIGVVAVLLGIFGYRANRRTNAATAQMQAELKTLMDEADEGSDVAEASADVASVDTAATNDAAADDASAAAPTPMASVLANFIFLAVLAAVFAYFGFEALGFRGKAAPFPRTIAFAALAVTVVEAISYARSVMVNRRELAAAGLDDSYLDAGPSPFRKAVGSVGRFLAWFAALYLAIWLFSIPLAVMVFLVAFLLVEGEMRWWQALLAGLLMLVFLVSLEDIMSLRWPDGRLFELPERVADWFPEKIPLVSRLA